jgi:tetratricopeptide (TPR) repeat protein
MATVYQDRAQYDQALQVLKESLQIQRDTGDENYQALCLDMIGSVYLSRGDSDNAFIYFQQSLQLRQKLNVPSDIADSLTGMGAAYLATGQYDQAVSSFLKAIDLWRKGGDARGAALGSHQLGLVFQYQGRLGPALSAMQDAAKPLRDLNDRTRDMADILNDYGDTMAKAGRGPEADKVLQEAQGVAHDLKNDSLQAAILNSQGDVQFYAGNWKAAKALYDEALRAASKGSERNKVLASKLSLARVANVDGRSRSVINDLRPLSQEADKQGIKYLALESTVEMAAAMVNIKDYPHARQELDRALGTSEKLGLRLQTARIHYLLGETMRLGGNAGDAPAQYRQAIAMLDQIRKDPGADHLLERVDLKSIYDNSTRWAQ